jgi:hypothetical protein
MKIGKREGLAEWPVTDAPPSGMMVPASEPSQRTIMTRLYCGILLSDVHMDVYGAPKRGAPLVL